MQKVKLLQEFIYIISTLGILMGIDLLLGAKITTKLNKFLDRTIWDLDKKIASVISHFRDAVDSSINIDDKIIKTKTRNVTGLLFIVICSVLIYLATRV